MRAKLINEGIKHLAPRSKEELAPIYAKQKEEYKEDLALLRKFIEDLKKIRISAKAKKDYNWDYFFQIDLTDLDYNYEDDYYDEGSVANLQVSFLTRKGIEVSEEEWEPGFGIADDNGSIIIDSTLDAKKLIKYLINKKFGSLSQINAKIKKLQNNIDSLEKAKNLLNPNES